MDALSIAIGIQPSLPIHYRKLNHNLETASDAWQETIAILQKAPPAVTREDQFKDDHPQSDKLLEILLI